MAKIIAEENTTMMMDLPTMEAFTREWWDLAIFTSCKEESKRLLVVVLQQVVEVLLWQVVAVLLQQVVEVVLCKLIRLKRIYNF
jgi:hypothetical protein